MTKWNRLKLEAADGKKYLTDVADPETLLRLVQSVSSPKVEPIELRADHTNRKRRTFHGQDHCHSLLPGWNREIEYNG